MKGIRKLRSSRTPLQSTLRPTCPLRLKRGIKPWTLSTVKETIICDRKLLRRADHNLFLGPESRKLESLPQTEENIFELARTASERH